MRILQYYILSSLPPSWWLCGSSFYFLFKNQSKSYWPWFVGVVDKLITEIKRKVFEPINGKQFIDNFLREVRFWYLVLRKSTIFIFLRSAFHSQENVGASCRATSAGSFLEDLTNLRQSFTNLEVLHLSRACHLFRPWEILTRLFIFALEEICYQVTRQLSGSLVSHTGLLVFLSHPRSVYLMFFPGHAHYHNVLPFLVISSCQVIHNIHGSKTIVLLGAYCRAPPFGLFWAQREWIGYTILQTYSILNGKLLGLGWYSEQAFESVHSDFSAAWERVKVPMDHPEFGARLLACISAYNSKHM